MISTAAKTRVHIVSGLVLAIFLASHFGNHALGIASVDLMERGRAGFNVVWRSWPGTILLYGALLGHFFLALDALWRRRSLRMPASEALKIGFGLALPLLISDHVIATRLEYALTGFVRGYPEVLRAINVSTGTIILYVTAAVVAWAHGCLGLWFWLRGRAWFQRFAPLFHMLAVVVPLLALTGMFSGLRWVSAMPLTPNELPGLELATLATIKTGFFAGYVLVIGGIVIIKFVPNKERIRIRYPGGRVVAIDPGTSVLEASRLAGIPHVSVCGGRGRCSTCRIRVIEGLDGQPEADGREKATLKSISAAPDVRLACQLRPVRDLTVSPLVDAGTLPQIVLPALDSAAGQERMVAALFCDLRGFTQLSERKLPYDVVFLLNRYFAVVGEAVASSGGVVDKFIGDGAIALFGLETSFPQACRQALQAAVKLGEGIEALNASFSSELKTPLRIAIGLHAGPAIVGRMGHGKVSSLTAIGDTINTASRLEGLAKERDVQLAVSADLVKTANISIPDHVSEDIEIRGREAELETWIVARVADIAAALEAPTEVRASA
jgi:adenylate cyclase